jgi:hypothetical protein
MLMDLTPAEREQGLAKSPTGGDGMEREGPALGPAGGSIQAQGVTWVIAIGIDQYDYPNPAVLRNFPYSNCKKDCDDLVSTLGRYYRNCQVYKDVLTDKQAKKDDILGRIDAFIKDKACNMIDNNLILFYSGHGCLYDNAGVDIGAWVPNGCQNIEDDNYLIRLDYLFNQVSGVRTRNFLLVSDSCKSGRIFDEIRPDGNTANAGGPGGGRSSWAIVSSRSNEDSKAGGPGENSKFTAALLNILQRNMDQELLVSTIAARLDQCFAQDDDQKPYSGRLVFRQVANTGVFALAANPDVQNNKQREAFLLNGLWTLNYRKQKSCWPGFKAAPKKAIVLLSGTPDCGLGHLSKRARKAQEFPAKKAQTVKAVPMTIGSMDTDEWLLNLFNCSPNQRFSHVEKLRAYISSVRKDENLIFEFSFYQDHGAEDELRPADKKKCIDLVAGFLTTIPDNDGDKYIAVFVLDQGGCDYQQLYTQSPILGTPAILTPIVDRLEYQEVEDWYNDFRSGQIAGDDDKEALFDALLKPIVYDKLQTIFTESAGFPGSLARMICREAQCVDLADTLQY